MTLDLLTEIYSSFEPFQPPSKEVYVDCQEVRGGWEVVRELGRKITRSKKPTCQLYSGHRGVGKSTELLRLKESARKRGDISETSARPLPGPSRDGSAP